MPFIQETHTKVLRGVAYDFTAGMIVNFLSSVPASASVSIKIERGHQLDPEEVVMTVDLSEQNGKGR